MPTNQRPPAPDDFDNRLKAARERREARVRKGPGKLGSSDSLGMGLGFRIAAEMVAAIGLGVAIGLFLDSELGTKPWMLILFLLLGAGGAFMNIMRTANEYERQAKERKAAEAGKPADSAGNIDDGDLK